MLRSALTRLSPVRILGGFFFFLSPGGPIITRLRLNWILLRNFRTYSVLNAPEHSRCSGKTLEISLFFLFSFSFFSSFLLGSRTIKHAIREFISYSYRTTNWRKNIIPTRFKRKGPIQLHPPQSQGLILPHSFSPNLGYACTAILWPLPLVKLIPVQIAFM